MAISLDYIRQLCREGESSHLDYKREQYPFVEVSDPEKAELLKDVLSMANAFRSQTAYILIGVEQLVGGIGDIIGIPKENFIDDASLQQFINEKLNRPIEFQSYSVPVDDTKVVQVIEIPEQKERPYYPLKQLGSIKSQTVKVRAGSSTHDATPDEIACMGKETQIQQNQRDIIIALDVPGNNIGDINFRAFKISLQGNPPVEDVSASYDFLRITRPVSFSQKITCIQKIFQTVRVDVSLENKAALSAEQLQVEAFISQCSYQCAKMVEGFPERPTEFPFVQTPILKNIGEKILHPGQCRPVFESFYFEIKHDGDFTLDIAVLGKDILPIKRQFHIEVLQMPYPVSAQEVEMFFKYFDDEEKYWDFRKSIHLKAR